MSSPARIGLFGAGLIGTEHARRLTSLDCTELAGIADPSLQAQQLADELGVPRWSDYREMLTQEQLDGVVMALPNRMHADATVTALKAGVATLVEKPLADTLQEASTIVEASERLGVPVLVGHQRRYAPDVVAARDLIGSGRLGDIVSVGLLSTWRKHDAYFDIAWRRELGGGPVLINLIHDLDVIRHLAGEITGVMALGSTAARGFEVADTVGAVLRFAGGAIGTALVSDAAAAPWCWDLTSGYGAYFPPPLRGTAAGDVYFIAGTRAALSLPSLTLFEHDGDPHWQNPIEPRVLDRVERDPYDAQFEHFADVARGLADPVIDARDGFGTLAVAEAVDAAQRSHSLEVPRRI